MAQFWSLGGSNITQFMTTQTQKEKLKQCMAEMGPFAAVFARANHATMTLLDWAVFGCFVVGVIGIIKAITMTSPSGVFVLPQPE